MRKLGAMAANSVTMVGLGPRRYPGRCLGPVMQRRSINTAREPLRSDAVLRSVQRVRRNSHRQFGSEPRHAGKKQTSATIPLEQVEKLATAGEVTAPIPCDAESLDADHAGVCTSACGHVEVPVGAEAPCVADLSGCVAAVPTASVLCAHDSQAELLDAPIAEHTSHAREPLKMIQLEHSASTASNFSSRASSSSSSSPLPTPRRPSWDGARGRSKSEIEAVLGLGVVTEQLRARHGKVDTLEAGDTWLKLAALGA